MISNKLKPGLSQVIDRDQTGFMANRRISVNIRKIFDLMYVASEEEWQAFIINCDFLKCFDRIEFTCIENSM